MKIFHLNAKNRGVVGGGSMFIPFGSFSLKFDMFIEKINAF
jgi:hypothetical protein